METLIALLNVLNSLSPLGIVALLAVIIFMLVKGKTSADHKVEVIANNHLHELPEAVEILRKIDGTLQRLEVKMSEEFAYLRAKLNGKS